MILDVGFVGWWHWWLILGVGFVGWWLWWWWWLILGVSVVDRWLWWWCLILIMGFMDLVFVVMVERWKKKVCGDYAVFVVVLCCGVFDFDEE